MVAQVGHFYFGAVGQFYIGADTLFHTSRIRRASRPLESWAQSEQLVKRRQEYLRYCPLQGHFMRTNDRKSLNAEVVSLKQASLSRALAAASQAVASGLVRTLPRTSTVRYSRQLRVKSD